MPNHWQGSQGICFDKVLSQRENPGKKMLWVCEFKGAGVPEGEQTMAAIQKHSRHSSEHLNNRKHEESVF